ncbi:MAG: ZIP family metal transporter [Candidatus Taylorbacteria bacterium]|nr:ZIP family metal transporter [Candidatus Taylorbacteria bacterium]
MEGPWLYTIVAVCAVGAISLIGIFTLPFSSKSLRRFVAMAVSISIGALYGDAFIHLIPEGFEKIQSSLLASLIVIVGIMSFFILEKYLEWRHAHGVTEETRETVETHDHGVKPLGVMVLFSDAVHNFVDGTIIAASFIVSPAIGIATTVAIILHEIPQEIANFGVLLHAGMSRRAALYYNFVSSLTALAGALAVIIFGAVFTELMPVILLIAAGHFIYIAGSDLVPELQRTRELKVSVLETLLILVGVALMAVLTTFE